jgi:hypothetical protein
MLEGGAEYELTQLNIQTHGTYKKALIKGLCIAEKLYPSTSDTITPKHAVLTPMTTVDIDIADKMM